MQDFKNRLYNYEDEPPAEIWENINAELNSDVQKVFSMSLLRRKSKLIFYGLTAAASLIIIFLSSVLFNKSGENQQPKTATPVAELQQNNLASKKIQDSITLNNKILDDIIKSSKNKNLLVQNYENPLTKEKIYITIAGPEGRPVNISTKVATLIVSVNNDYPPKPVWNKKIEKWKKIMLGSTLSSTPTDLLDIAQVASTIDNNE